MARRLKETLKGMLMIYVKELGQIEIAVYSKVIY